MTAFHSRRLFRRIFFVEAAVKHNENFRLKVYFIVKKCVVEWFLRGRNVLFAAFIFVSHATIYGLRRAILLSFLQALGTF